MSQTKKFWTWNQTENESGVSRELEICGTIAEESWFDDDVTPAMFKDELFSGKGPITVWINSPGGDCIAASQIYTMLMDYKDDVTVKIDGIAASAASVIAMAGTKVLMAPTALMMIHNPATVAMGDHKDMKKAIEMLDEVKESIINAYEIRTLLSRSELSRLMDKETWMSAGKAVELGFADDILGDEKTVTNMASYTFSRNNVQAALLNKISAKTEITEPEISPESEDGKELEISPQEEKEIHDKTEIEDKAVTTEPEGRSVDELKANLQIIKNYI